MDATGPRRWWMLALAGAVGAGVLTAPTGPPAAAARVASHQTLPADDDRVRHGHLPGRRDVAAARGGTAATGRSGAGAAARIRQWALSDTELAPEDARAVWEATVGLADRSRRRCPAPKPILAALRRITDGELEPEVRRHELVLWRGRAGEPPATARKWAGSAEYRVPRPGRPDRYRILVHPSGRVGYSTDHYRRIREFHPGGGCDCAGGQRR